MNARRSGERRSGGRRSGGRRSGGRLQCVGVRLPRVRSHGVRRVQPDTIIHFTTVQAFLWNIRFVIGALYLHSRGSN